DFDQFDQVINLDSSDGTPVSPPRKMGHYLSGIGGVGRRLDRATRKNLLDRSRGWTFTLLERANDVEIHWEKSIGRPGHAGRGLGWVWALVGGGKPFKCS